MGSKRDSYHWMKRFCFLLPKYTFFICKLSLFKPFYWKQKHIDIEVSVSAFTSKKISINLSKWFIFNIIKLKNINWFLMFVVILKQTLFWSISKQSISSHFCHFYPTCLHLGSLFFFLSFSLFLMCPDITFLKSVSNRELLSPMKIIVSRKIKINVICSLCL